MIPLELLKEFYIIGRSEDFTALDKIPANVVKDYSYIMREPPDVWYEMTARISTDDVVSLMKTLTIAERVLSGWSAGSVSPVIWLGMDLTVQPLLFIIIKRTNELQLCAGEESFVFMG